MSRVRLKRLSADASAMERAFASHPYIRVTEMEGDPPERYKVEFKLQSVVIQNGNVVPKGVHVAEVYMPLGYPRQAPQCRMLSPIFHPNIAPHAICIGDHWSAGESLAVLVARIGEMITYQSYNVKSPLNGEAARWAEQNMERLPIQKVDLTVDAEAAAPAPEPAAPAALATKFASARVPAVDGLPFPYDEWLDSAVAETSMDPDAAIVVPVLSSVVKNLKEGSLEGAVKAFAPVSRSPAVGRLPQLHFLVSLLRAQQGAADKQMAALEQAVKIDQTYALAWQQLALVAERAGDAAKAASASAHFARF